MLRDEKADKGSKEESDALTDYTEELYGPPSTGQVSNSEWIERALLNQMPDEFIKLVRKIKSSKDDKNDVVLFSIGCSGAVGHSNHQQKLPHFIHHFADEGKKVKIFLIDPYITADEVITAIKKSYITKIHIIRPNSSTIVIEPNIQITLAPCLLPNREKLACKFIYNELDELTRSVIESHGKVFIANHTTQRFDDIPKLMESYNQIKSILGSKQSELQIYASCGKRDNVICLGDALFDKSQLPLPITMSEVNKKFSASSSSKMTKDSEIDSSDKKINSSEKKGLAPR